VKKDLAQTKSLEEVKGEISSHILGQKSLHAISRLAEKVLAAFRENPDVDSAEVNKLLSDNSWTTKHNFLLLQMDSAKRESFSKEEELVFANIDSKKTAGKSVEGSTGVVKTDFGVTAYVVTKVSWPTMKPFDKVKKQAEGSYVKQVASERSKLFVEDLHRKLLNKDVSWDDLASEIGIKETKSSLDSLENLKDKHKNMALVIQKSFKLSDSKQVLRQKDDHDYYIVKLSEKEEGTAKETQEIAQTNRFGGDYKEMVLADLVKAAKIESSEGLVDLLDDNATLGGR
jgi:hypothetical protein